MNDAPEQSTNDLLEGNPSISSTEHEAIPVNADAPAIQPPTLDEPPVAPLTEDVLSPAATRQVDVAPAEPSEPAQAPVLTPAHHDILSQIEAKVDMVREDIGAEIKKLIAALRGL